MNEISQRVFERALKLSNEGKALLIDQLQASLEAPDEVVDSLWVHEAEHRVEGYRAGRIRSASLETVLKKYQING